MPRKISVDRKVNKFRLEDEHAQQADIFHYWAKKAAEAKEERDRIKIELKKLEDATMVEIFKGAYPIPINAKTEKPISVTGPVAAALVGNDEEVYAKREELVVAEGKYSKAAAAEACLEHKRSSLKHLTELYTRQYYQESGDGTGTNFSNTESGTDGQHKKLNENKKKKETK